MRNVTLRFHRAGLLRILTACAAVLPLTGRAALAAPPVAPPAVISSTPLVNLAEDSRLKRSLTLDEFGVPLDELLKKLSDKELTLSAGRSCKDQKVQLRLKQRSLSSLMEALAELLPGAWKPITGGYRLEMDEKAAARRERWWRLFEGERERALAAQRAFVLQKMREQPYHRKPSDPNPENSDVRVEAQNAANQEFFRSLPASLQESIAGQMNPGTFYKGYLGAIGEDEIGTTAVPFDQLPSVAQKAIKERSAATPGGSPGEPVWSGATIIFLNESVGVRATLVPQNGRSVGIVASLPVGVAPAASTLPLEQTWLVDEVARLGRGAPPTWKQLAAYQRSRVWENDPSSSRPARWPPPRRADVLQSLGEQDDIEFVADYYSRPSSITQPDLKKQRLTRSSKKSLKAELDYRAVEQDMSWKQRDDTLYLFRNNRWYRDDRLEVPAPLLRRWMAARADTYAEDEPNAKPNEENNESATLADVLRKEMDWEAEVVTTLTRWQISNGLKWFVSDELLNARDKNGRPLAETAQNTPNEWFPFSYGVFPFRFDTDRILPQYNTALFYAGLNADARTRLLEGELPLAALGPAQRAEAARLSPGVAARMQSPSAAPILLGLRPAALPRAPLTKRSILLSIRLFASRASETNP